jgi:IclR family acetate operon transcriptional repressor
MVDNQEPDTRKTTQTSLSILESIKELGGGTLSEIADETGLAASTLHTHLRTLEESEYIVRSDGTYYLGMKLFHFGEHARLRDARYRIARQTAADLADKVSEEVNFAIEEYGRSIILFDETSTGHREEFQVGRYFHMHSSASGKAMLAEYPESRVREIIDRHGLPGHTENTITSSDRLFDELERVRERGYALNRQEELDGLRAIAMVVTEPGGDVFGTLDISGPAYRLPDDADVAAQLEPYVEDLEAALEEYATDESR